jgi:diguanylate cyclase (GGDEF)-like protein/PAS domain S-box-containing protein
VTGLPDSQASRAVFIGAYDFASLAALPAVENNLSALSGLFTGKAWQLPDGHCTVVRNPVTPRGLSKPVWDAAHDATDTLLIYYAGHGLIEPKTGQLHLAVADSDVESVHDTAAPYEWIRWAVESSRAARKVVILDCCYSARAFGVQSAAEADLSVQGTFLLAASAENAAALSPPEEPFTAFTGELVRLLEYGVPSEDDEFLDLDTIFKQLRVELSAKGRPAPHRLCRDRLGCFPFAPNRAYTSPVAPGKENGSASPPPVREDLPADGRTATLRYVSLASLAEVHDAVAQLGMPRSMADTLQAIADGAAGALGYGLAVVHLVRPDANLMVAAVAGGEDDEATLAGRTSSRDSWERHLSKGERWRELRFVPAVRGRSHGVQEDARRSGGPWRAGDRLYAPMHASDGDLLAVLELDAPRDGRRPGDWERAALRLYASQAAMAITHTRLRGNMQRALIRLEQEQQALRASEEEFRQAFEYAPGAVAIAEVGGESHGRLIRVNDALCRLLGRPAALLRRYSFAELVHPDDVSVLRTAAEGGRAELWLQRRDGSYVWVSLRNSVVADTANGPHMLLTYVEDIEERKQRELWLARRLSEDPLTSLLNGTELRARLGGLICDVPYDAAPHARHEHVQLPDAEFGDGTGLAVVFCDVVGLKTINIQFGHRVGDTVLIEVARRLADGVRDNDTLARLGSDEFVILVEGVSRAGAADLADRLGRLLAAPMALDGRDVPVTVLVGVSWAHCGASADETLRGAVEDAYMATARVG